jgi:hypothetical protein
MALNGINIAEFKSKSRNQQMIMPFENPLLRNLAFSKLVDATMQKNSMSGMIQRELLDKIRICLQSMCKNNTQITLLLGVHYKAILI